MADVDLLPPRGVPYLALVDANGIAIGGTSTTAQLAAKGMKAICQVDPTGLASSDGASTVALLASRGIRAFAAVDENGVSVDDAVTKADVIRSRGIRPMVAVDVNGVSQTGPATIPVIAQRGLSYFCPVDETGTAGSLIPVPPNTIRARPGIFTLSGENMIPTVGWVMSAGMGAFALIDPGTTQLTPPLAANTKWNPADKDAGITLSPGNLTATNNTGSAFSVVRAVASHTTGKFYYEITAVTQTFASFSHFGIATGAASLSNFLGNDTNAAIMSGVGQANINGSTIGTGDALNVNGEVMGIAADLSAKKLWFWNSSAARWNGDILANQNPATGTGGFTYTALAAGPYFPAIDIWQLNDQFTANFGATAYSITAPSGFGNW